MTNPEQTRETRAPERASEGRVAGRPSGPETGAQRRAQRVEQFRALAKRLVAGAEEIPDIAMRHKMTTAAAELNESADALEKPGGRKFDL